MTPLETIITIFATALSVIAIGSNYVLFREYIDAFLIGFLVSQIFRDLKKRVRKYTQKFSNNIFTLTTDTQNTIGTIFVLITVIVSTIFFTFFWSKQCLLEAKEAIHMFVEWVENSLSKADAPSSSSFYTSSSTSSSSTLSDGNNMILSFIKEKKEIFGKYIEMLEDHTVINATSNTAIEDGQKLIMEGSTFSVEYFRKIGSLFMNATLRQELLDQIEGGIEIEPHIQKFSEIAVSSIVNVILVAGDVIVNLSVFIVALYYNLLSDKDLIQNLCNDVLPIDPRLTNDISRSISDTMEDIIMLPIRIGVFRIFSTWFLFHIVQVPFPYFATLLMLFSAIIPVLTPIIIMLPWIIGMLFVKQWMQVVALLIFTLYVLPAYDALEYKKGLRMHPYIISLSILTGFREFGFPGILYGPLILCFGKLFYITVKKLKVSKSDTLSENSFFSDSDEVISEALKHYNSRQSVFNVRRRAATSPPTIPSPRTSTSNDHINNNSSTYDENVNHNGISRFGNRNTTPSPKVVTFSGDNCNNNTTNNVKSKRKNGTGGEEEINALDYNDLLQNMDRATVGSLLDNSNKRRNKDDNKPPPFLATSRRNTTIGKEKSKNSKSYTNLRQTKSKNDISPFVVANTNGAKSKRRGENSNNNSPADSLKKEKLVSNAKNQLQGLIRANKNKLKALARANKNKAVTKNSNGNSGTWK